MGIQFTNHPDLRRLFLEDDFQGFPLRKDFVDEVNIIQK
jgi:NADH:ubiquinone oxidoreductase subunit C